MFNVKDSTILLTVSGSRAYGMNHAASDVDLQGVCVPPREYFHGFVNCFEQANSPSHIQPFFSNLNDEEQVAAGSTKLEGTVFGVLKFFALARDCNPNIIQTLFAEDASVRVCTPLGARLRESREMFLSKAARFRFSGYAMSQLKRIQLHRGYLLSPKEEKPTRESFGLPTVPQIDPSQFGMVRAEVDRQMDCWNSGFVGELDESMKIRLRESIAGLLSELKITEETKIQAACNKLGFDTNFTAYFQTENRYNSAVKEWESYQRWKSERNSVRAAMEARFGYDGKHAAHLVRLMRMCVEILRDGEVHVMRPDAKELLAIRSGAWTYDHLIEVAADLESQCASLYKTSTLPHHPDIKAIDELCIEIVERNLRGEK